MGEVAALESDPDLLARCRNLLAAPDATELRKLDIHAVLYLLM
jgi:hypothetical protein